MNREEIYIPKMRVENDWIPKDWDLPDQIHERFHLFPPLLPNYSKSAAAARIIFFHTRNLPSRPSANVTTFLLFNAIRISVQQSSTLSIISN